MPIEISTQIIHASYAAVINSIDPNANIYDNPNQQGTAYPAWFIVHRAPVEVLRDFGKRRGGNRYTLTYQIDIWYMIQQNIPRLYDQYTEIAERLDEQIEYLPIHGSDAVVHVYDRSWSLELNCLKYSTTLRLRVYRDNPDYQNEKTIDVISTEVFLKSLFPLLRVYFANATHPDIHIDLPEKVFCYYGDTIVLPTITGIYKDSNNVRWEPVRWDVGDFGKTIGPLYKSTTANLIMSEVIGVDNPITGTVSNISSTETVIRMSSMTADRQPNYLNTRTLIDEQVEDVGVISANRRPSYLNTRTLVDEQMPMGGTVEKFEPYQTAYFTNYGSASATNYYLSFGNHQLYYPDGHIIVTVPGHTYTLVKVYDYAGNEVTPPSSFSGPFDNSGTVCVKTFDSFYAYKLTYIESGT